MRKKRSNAGTGAGGRARQAIAVVGVGCRYPGAASPAELWQNILARRQQFRPMPDVRLPLAEYQDDDSSVADRTYGRQAAVIDGYEFDWAARRIPRSTAQATDIVHWLALDTALQMLEDAGYDSARLPRETTQVIVGNTLTGEFTRSNTLRLRWPYVRKALRASAPAAGLPAAALGRLELQMEAVFKSPFAPVTEDTLAGGLANTIAGRISNYLDVNGGGYTVDGACCASLIAVYTGARSLIAGDADFVIAGGVDISLDPFELIGFAKTGALTPTAMRVYDRRGNGFIPGEGCGFVGLKRLDDARRDGDRIYAVLDGWGMSSDGRGGITAPNVAGQHLALARAYRQAGADPGELAFIEGHGTGTALGDRTELLAIARTLADGRGTPRHCGVTSFKSIVGHTKAAAGIGAFIKAVMAVNQRVLPPTAGCEQPHEVFAEPGRTIYPLLRGEQRPAGEHLRAGVSAMGFGGINVHVTLTSPEGAPEASLRGPLDARSAMASVQASELFVFAGGDAGELARTLQAARQTASGISQAELADFAAHCAHQCGAGQRARAAVVAAAPRELGERLEQTLAQLDAGLAAGAPRLDMVHGIAIGHCAAVPRIGFVFPGQGSQQLGMARTLVERHVWARELVAEAGAWAEQLGTPGLVEAISPALDRLPHPQDREPLVQALRQTELAQPAIVLASLLWLRQLQALGLQPACVLGHSLGELVAFHAAGAFGERELIELATVRGRQMAARPGSAGAMASLGCDRGRAQSLLERTAAAGYAVLANINSDAQMIVSGELPAIEAVCALAERENVRTHRLPVSNAFHSQLVAEAADHLRMHAPIPRRPVSLRVGVLSSCDGLPVEPACDLHRHFSEQILRPVEFATAAGALAGRVDLLIEVGPGQVLSQLIARTAGAGGIACVPVEPQAEDHTGLNLALASAHVHGADPDWQALYADRVLRPFVPASQRRFIVNPCERPLEPAIEGGEVAADHDAAAAAAGLPPAQLVDTALAHLRDYLSHRGGFLADVIRADLRNGHALAGAPAAVVPPLVVSAEPVAPEPTEPQQSVATVASKSSSRAPASEVLRRTVARVTGFAESSIDPAMTLIDDLNLDSIKAGALIAEVANEFGVGGQVDASELTGASLEVVASRLEALRAVEPGGPRPSPGTRLDPESLLIAALAQATGFAPERISPGMHMVDDLNLDSIKVGAVLADVAAQLDLGGRVDPGERPGDRIDEIAQWLHAQSPSAMAESVTPASEQRPVPKSAAVDAAVAGWARAYVLQRVFEEEAGEPSADALNGASIHLQYATGDEMPAAEIGRQLAAAGAQLLQGTDSDVDIDAYADGIDHWIAILPRTGPMDDTNDCDRPDCLPDLIAPLHRAADSARRHRSRSLTFVQFGLGASLADGAAAALGSSCAQAFAASVHLEQPRLAVRVLDFDADVADVQIAHAVCDGLAAAGGYRAWSFDAEGRRARLAPRLLESGLLPARAIEWSPQDVVLVTGGGKGITAELALAFAQRTGARMVLVGSTERAGSTEIEATLARYAHAGLEASYYACDMGDEPAVAELAARVAREIGPITALVHGAGTNRPRRVEQVPSGQALAEIRPKLGGVLALRAALDAQPLKLVVGLGSIIGVTGMPGNAWYAFSNQALDVALARWQACRPETEVLTLAYSIWAEVGMGARLGSDRRLAQQGISAIAPDAGVEQFLALALGAAPARQVIVAGRLGGLDTWQPDRNASPGKRRFLDEVSVFEPGVELVARTRLTLAQDLYLRDHYYRGVYLFPTVMGLEAMIQSALAVLGIDAVASVALEDVQLERPIVVDGERGAGIEIRALVLPRQDPSQPVRVEVAIHCEQTGYRRGHFACVAVVESLPPSHSAPPAAAEAIEQLDPRIDLYGGLLFQGEMFQRLSAVHDMDRSGSHTTIERRRDDCYFDSMLPATLVAGDPSFRDALLQTAQLSEQGQFLPVGIDRVELHDCSTMVQGPLQVRTEVTARDGDSLVCDVVAYAEDGRIVERLRGYRLKRLHLDRAAPRPEDWRDPGERDSRLLAAALHQACGSLAVTAPQLVLKYAPYLSRMERARRRLGELPLFLDAISAVLPETWRTSPEQFELHWDESGKPLLSGTPADSKLGVSLSHDASHCLATCGQAPQGCDMEPILPREREAWHALLGQRRVAMLYALEAGGDDLDTAGTRLWCALEAARKLLGTGAIDLRQVRREAQAVTFSAGLDVARLVADQPDAGRRDVPALILTFPMTPTRPRPKMFAVAVTAALDEARPAVVADVVPAMPDGRDIGVSTERGSFGETCTISRFRVPFKDVTTIRHGLNFPVFANWMGQLRELSIAGIARQLVPDFASGEWGMVTNHSDITVVGDAGCLDLIEGRLWVSRVYGKLDSSVDLHFDWLRVDEDGRRTRIAHSNMATTWVAIKGHGVVELAPFPDYLGAFTRRYLPTRPLPAAAAELREPLPEPLAGLALEGPALYTAPAAPRIEPELLRQVFSTSMEESNLVGNIYFSNYYHWQSRLIDRLLFKLAPAVLRGGPDAGALQCLRSSIQHLREAMPFDEIEVVMALGQLHATGLRLHFEYCQLAGSQRNKLAVGQADCVWVAVSAPGCAAPLPAVLRDGLLGICGAARAAEAVDG